MASSSSSSSRLGHRRAAGELLADVGGGAAVDGVAAFQQRHAVGLAAREDEVRPERVADDALQRAELVADQRDLLDLREAEVERLEQVGEGLRMPRDDLVQQAEDADSARSAYSCSPVSAASRSRP